MARFRVALSGDFLNDDGSPALPAFDLAPLRERAGIELAFLETRDEIGPDQVADVDALILLKPRITAQSFHPDRRLALVARFGVGYDNVDLAACSAHDVALVITPDGVRRPVAVAVLTLMLALTGRLQDKDRLARQGPAGWAQKTDYNGLGLVGRTLGSLGLGNIGAEVFRVARPLEMRFIAHDPQADAALAAEMGVELLGLDEVFRRSDVLTLNCPLSAATRHLVNAERLALMKPGAYLINTARGGIVDQAALTAALRDGVIAGAGLDVLEREPPDPEDPILRLDNAIVTPHALCWTDQLFAGNGAADVAAVLEVMAGRVPRGLVNREVLESPAWRRRLEDYRARFTG